MSSTIRFAGVATLALLAATASAAPITSTVNVRPETIGVAPGAETPLSAILTGLFDTPMDASTAQSSAGVFGFSAPGSGSTIPTLVIEQTDGATVQSFGVWFGSDSSNLLRWTLFNGAAVGGAGALTQSSASLLVENGAFRVNASNGTCGLQINCTPGIITDSRVSVNFFGFWFQTADNPIYYTLDFLSPGYTPANPGGYQSRVLAYNKPSTDTWAFAYEDGSDFDYNDMVVKVESIRAVPLPGSLALMGLGLVGLAALRRKQA